MLNPEQLRGPSPVSQLPVSYEGACQSEGCEEEAKEDDVEGKPAERWQQIPRRMHRLRSSALGGVCSQQQLPHSPP
jgi:hypothetical protein